MDKDHLKPQLEHWFSHLRDTLCEEFEKLEQECVHPHLLPGRFSRHSWTRQDLTQPNQEGGGGVMSLMKGRVFEKVGVNVSTVYGMFSPEFAHQIQGTQDDPHFWAAGVSVVAHPLNPFVPIIHMNTRYIVTTKSWFGGGIDLTPAIEFQEDTKEFHMTLKQACDPFDPNYYPRFKWECDEYFYLKHRKEPRGVGGIFYDHHDSGNPQKDFDMTKAVGNAFLDIYPKLVRRHYQKPWGPDEKQKQLLKRGRYVEFNLLYDRGTKFGLETEGNVDAIFMSFPPLALWS